MQPEPSPDEHAIAPAATSVTAFVAAGAGPGEPVALDGPDAISRAVADCAADDPLAIALGRYVAAGGERALVVAAPDGELSAALAGLDDAPPFSLLVVAAVADAELRRAASHVAHAHHALYLADPDPAWSAAPTDVTEFGEGMVRANAAVYFPPAAGGAPIAASIAGMLARSDRERGVWAPAAGPEAALTGVQRLALALDEGDTERLAAIGVTPVRAFPRVGPILTHARTLAGDSEWRYVSVRRTALFLEASIGRGLAWAAFEPNGEPLWAEVRRVVGDFLTARWREGMLLGSRPDSAFFVRCDRTTMTQADIDGGRLVVLIGIAKVRPAEFVVLRFALAAAPPG